MHVSRIGTATDLAITVRRLRRDAGLTQVALAERAQVSRRLVISMEAGKPRLELIGVLAVLEALGHELAAVPILNEVDPPLRAPAPW